MGAMTMRFFSFSDLKAKGANRASALKAALRAK